MTKEEREARAARVKHLKGETLTAKSRLIDIMYRLEEVGAIKEAKRLERIIWKLEAWQNT